MKRRLEVCKAIRATTLFRKGPPIFGYGGSYVSFARRIRVLRPVVVKEPRSASRPLLASRCRSTGPRRALDARKRHGRAQGSGPDPRLLAHGGDRTSDRSDPCHDAVFDPASPARARGVANEVLTDRDVAFVIGETTEHQPIFAPEWVDQALALQTTPRACRPHRAKTKGKVERVIQEVKADFLPWLTGQGLAPRPSLYDYEPLARTWAHDVVAGCRHRTTERVVGEAWARERAHLKPIPKRLLTLWTGCEVGPINVIDIEAERAGGETVEHRDLSAYLFGVPSG